MHTGLVEAYGWAHFGLGHGQPLCQIGRIMRVAASVASNAPVGVCETAVWGLMAVTGAVHAALGVEEVGTRLSLPVVSRLVEVNVHQLSSYQ